MRRSSQAQPADKKPARKQNYPRGATIARFPGICQRCLGQFHTGDQIAKVVPGWGHHVCVSYKPLLERPD